jgi:hypothetical protein
MLHLQLQAHDLVFLIPMALVGLLAMGAIPVAAKALRISCRCAARSWESCLGYWCWKPCHC